MDFRIYLFSDESSRIGVVCCRFWDVGGSNLGPYLTTTGGDEASERRWICSPEHRRRLICSPPPPISTAAHTITSHLHRIDSSGNQAIKNLNQPLNLESFRVLYQEGDLSMQLDLKHTHTHSHTNTRSRKWAKIGSGKSWKQVMDHFFRSLTRFSISTIVLAILISSFSFTSTEVYDAQKNSNSKP